MDGLLEDFQDGNFELDFNQKFSNDEEQEEVDEEESQSEESQEDDTQDEESDDSEEQESDEDEQEESEELEEDETSYSGLVEYLTEKGIIPDDLELEVEDSEEGLAQVFEATIDKKWNDTISSLSPKAQKLLEIELNGGDIEEAFKVLDDIDYASIDIQDEDVRKELLIDYYKDINPKWSDSKVTKIVDGLFDSGEDEEEAEEAKSHFVEKQEKTQAEYLDSIKQARQEQEEAIQKELETYNEIITKNDGFAGIKFSDKKDKESFRSYLFERDKSGLTQYEKDLSNEEDRIKQAFFAYKKFNFETIKKKAVTESTVKIKKLATRYKDTNQSSARQENTRRDNTGFSIGNLDF